MFDNKKKRCSNSAIQKYKKQVQMYLNYYSFEIVQRIYNGSLNVHELTEEGVRNTLIGIWPIAPWVKKENVIEQFIALLEEVGYSFAYNDDGKYCFKDEDIYGAIVKNHLRFSGCDILEALSDCCEKNGGRITYFQAKMVLGAGYPKAPFVNKADVRACIIMFLKETGIPFVFDDAYLYFP